MKPILKNISVILISLFAIASSAEADSSRLQSSADTCGIPKVTSGYIVRGQSFSRGNFPWIVALVYTKVRPPAFFCAGTLISQRFVITGKKIKP